MAWSATLTSAQDGTTLSLWDAAKRRLRDSDGPEYYEVQVSGPNVSARQQVYGYAGTGLPELFESLAHNWKGWDGEKLWPSLEGEFSLSATAERLAHVRLGYRLCGDVVGKETWELKGSLFPEAGQLDAIAREMRAFRDASATECPRFAVDDTRRRG
jgi:Family of unknown function (DUF6228)